MKSFIITSIVLLFTTGILASENDNYSLLLGTSFDRNVHLNVVDGTTTDMSDINISGTVTILGLERTITKEGKLTISAGLFAELPMSDNDEIYATGVYGKAKIKPFKYFYGGAKVGLVKYMKNIYFTSPQPLHAALLLGVTYKKTSLELGYNLNPLNGGMSAMEYYNYISLSVLYSF